MRGGCLYAVKNFTVRCKVAHNRIVVTRPLIELRPGNAGTNMPIAHHKLFGRGMLGLLFALADDAFEVA